MTDMVEKSALLLILFLLLSATTVARGIVAVAHPPDSTRFRFPCFRAPAENPPPAPLALLVSDSDAVGGGGVGGWILGGGFFEDEEDPSPRFPPIRDFWDRDLFFGFFDVNVDLLRGGAGEGRFGGGWGGKLSPNIMDRRGVVTNICEPWDRGHSDSSEDGFGRSASTGSASTASTSASVPPPPLLLPTLRMISSGIGVRTKRGGDTPCVIGGRSASRF